MSTRLQVDGRTIETSAGRDLLSVCLEHDIMVPHFCWHGALGSVGACRLCAVQVYDGPDDETGRLEMACMTPAENGQRVQVEAPAAREFRARIIEWLMVNHPHDCAVCEEGGACHLQDMTVATGHVRRRYRFTKRTHRNQYLGPLLTHEMNRCIACYRCTRFYRDYAGGKDLDVFASNERVYFGRAGDGVLESPFAGNLAEICPTGVFDDRGWSLDFAREWDMQTTPSVCTHCAVGCNLFVSQRHDRVRRVTNRYHSELNGYFLCDRGRFGPRIDGAPSRLTHAHLGGAVAVDGDAVNAAAAMLGGDTIGIGSPRASLESNFALQRLVGAERFFAGVSDAEVALVRRIQQTVLSGSPRTTSVAGMENADAVLVLGEDLTGTAPRAALALRQTSLGAARALAAEKGVASWLDRAGRTAGEGRRTPIILVGPAPDPLEDVATTVLRRSASETAAFGLAVARALTGETDDEEATAVARTLERAQRPLVIAGAGLGRPEVIDAAVAVCDRLGEDARIALLPPEANSLGLSLLGGDGVDSACRALETGRARHVLILENDLRERIEADTVARLLRAAQRVVVLDHTATQMISDADAVIPVANALEAAGTAINYEGRAQRAFAAVAGGRPAAWRVLAQLLPAARPAWETLDALLDDLARAHPRLAGVRDAAPPAASAPTHASRIARAPTRYSGRTAADLAGRVPAGTPPADPDSPLAFTMEGRHRNLPAALITSYGAPGLHSPSATHTVQQTIGGPVRGGDPGILLRDGAAPPHPQSPPGGHGRADELPGTGLLPVLLHDPFRGDEACRQSPLLAERTPAPTVRLHPDDADARDLADGDSVSLDGRAGEGTFTLVVDARLPPGHVGVTSGAGIARGLRRRIEVEAASSTS